MLNRTVLNPYAIDQSRSQDQLILYDVSRTNLFYKMINKRERVEQATGMLA